MKAWLNFLIFLATLLAGCKKGPDIAQVSYLAPFMHLSNDSFGLVILSSIEGYVEPCGCTSDPLGGLAQFATVYKGVKLALGGRIALIDAGNLLFDSLSRNEADLCQDNGRLQLLLSTLKKLGMRTVFSGPLDNARGLRFRDDLYRTYDFSRLFPIGEMGPEQHAFTHVNIVRTKDYDIAILGALMRNNSPIAELRQDIEEKAKQLASQKSIKAVVFLSQMDIEQTKLVFDGMTGVDLVILGQSPTFSPKPPIKLGKTGPFLIEAGRQGQYFTVITLQELAKRSHEPLLLDTREFDRNERASLLTSRVKALSKQAASLTGDRLSFIEKRIALAKQELVKLEQPTDMAPLTSPNVAFFAIPLTRKITPDPQVAKELLAYNKSVPLLVTQCEENIQCPKAEKGQATYVGANSCKGCHAQAFSVWEKAVFIGKSLDQSGHAITRSIGHSKAWQTLVDDNKDKDRSCVGCHSVGFMEKGGFCKVSDVGFHKNVQCESCHGPGSLHATSGDKALIKGRVPEETCRSCHHVPHIESYDSFNYDEKLVRILGPGHGERLLKEITHKLNQSK